MWRKRKTTTVKETPKAPDLTVNLAWPDGNGFTQCSNEYYAISMALENSNPAHSASPTPEDYEQYAALLRDQNRLLAEGHTGKSFRFDQSGSESKSTGKKIRMNQGFFCIERSYGALH
jgi:hypothetical protein